MKRLLTTCLAALLGCALTTLAVTSSQAQEWPTRQPIKVIVTLSPGSATDVLARLAFEQVSKQIGQAIVIENRPGAGQRIGAAAAARAEGDGYTLLVGALALMGDITVHAGDLVVGDGDGVVVLPHQQAAAIVAAGHQREQDEAAICERLKAGETTMSVYGWGV